MSLSQTLYARRRATNVVALTLALASMAFGLFWLLWILWTLTSNGFAALSPVLFTEMTPPPGSSGGLLNAIVGSLLMSGIATAVGTPIGIMAGTYLSEFGGGGWLAPVTRFINGVLLSAPSVVIGFFIYALVVPRMGHFSGWAGAMALAVILIPVVVSSTENMLRLVPASLREAAAALGAPQWKVTTMICLKAARSGIITGVLLALARISGETAPLLFTAFGNNYMTFNPSDKMSSLPQMIYQYANDPGEGLHAIAWAGAFVLTMFVLLLSLASRLVLSRSKVSHD